MVGDDSVLDELRELLLVSLFIFVHQLAHVIGNMEAHDVFAVSLGVEVLRLGVVTGETFGAVGHIDAAIHGALHGAEDAGSGGGASQSHVKEGSEGAWAVFNIFDIVDSTSHFSGPGVDGVQFELLQQL